MQQKTNLDATMDSNLIFREGTFAGQTIRITEDQYASVYVLSIYQCLDRAGARHDVHRRDFAGAVGIPKA